MKRICSVCKIEKSIDNFSRKRDGYQHYCKKCHSEYRKKHYEANKKKYIKKARIWSNSKKTSRRQFLLQFFKENPCKDCGESDPRVLEFDHVKGDKITNVSQMMHHNEISFNVEISKCEVVCANCHRKRTIDRDKRHWYHTII